MILRRPYAILIKYFKLIHIIMFVCFSYLVFVIRKIYIFFSDYVKTGNYTYFEDMTSKYIPIIVFFIVILVLALSIGIFLLMRRKDKPVLFYKILIGYCSLLLVAFIYFYAFFKSLDTSIYEPLRLVVNRDIILFIYIVNFAFVIFSFIRGFGFDIKKFSFDKDKRELNLEESDSEEYEVNVKLEKEDVVNYINKQKRELSYYVKENSLILSIAGGLILVVIILVIYFNFFVINKVYKEGDDVSIGKLLYKVNNSYITNIDKYGKSLEGDSDFLVVSFNITNNQGTGYLDKQALRVHVDDEYFYPINTICDMFDDMGECYKNQELKLNKTYDFIIAYKINKNHNKIYLEILKDKSDEYKYSKVLLDYKSITKDVGNYKLNDSFKIKNEEYQINNYELYDKTEYHYQECVDGKCNDYVKVVSPKVGDIVLSLDITNLEKMSDDFLNSAFGLKYENVTVYGNEVKYLDKHDNKLYLSIPSNAKNSNNITLTITTRDKLYNIVLNGG